MNLCSIFTLTVFLSGNSDCQFILNWNNEQKKAELQYPQQLDDLYNEWQDCYQRAYPFSLRGRVVEEGGLTPKSIDWSAKAETARLELLKKFQTWLESAELIEIRNRIESKANHKPSIKRKKTNIYPCVDLLIACNSPKLKRLPWEAWQLPTETSPLSNIHISRTSLETEEGPCLTARQSKMRVLAVFADTSHSNLEQDRQAIALDLEKDLQIIEYFCRRRSIELTTLKFKPSQSRDEIKQSLRDTLIDDRGWDILFFSGHSTESGLTNGQLELAPDTSIFIESLKHEFIRAKNLGLRLAIFNSCKGLEIGERLIQFGLSQVVVMREKIHDSVAHIFLEKLCQNLAAHENIQDAVLKGCQYLESEKNAYPSGYLIPSLFRHRSPEAELFYIERSGLKQFWHTWKPSRTESVFVGTTLLLSLMIPFQETLYDVRQFSQSFIRNTIDRIHQNVRPDIPPVYFISIDQPSINQALEEYENFLIQPIDRRYLAEIVEKLSELEVKTIGINYVLNADPIAPANNESLRHEITTAIAKSNPNKTWFTLAVSNGEKVIESVATTDSILEGDTIVYPFDMTLPSNELCPDPEEDSQNPHCPFSYLLALSHLLQSKPSLSDRLPQPSLTDDNADSFQKKIYDFLKDNTDNLVVSKILRTLQKSYSSWGMKSIIDLSIRPDRVYEKISAEAFLKQGDLTPEAKEKLRSQVVIIAYGGYSKAGFGEPQGAFSVPLAVEYWCHSGKVEYWTPPDRCPKIFTGGEILAYMVHHFLREHRVSALSSFWMIFLVNVIGAIAGQFTAFFLMKQDRERRTQWFYLLLISLPSVYGIFVLSAYIVLSVSIPWLFPSSIVLFYLFKAQRRFYV